MKKQTLFKQFSPLIIAFVGAAAFFLCYNHYLLDRSFANLKISLKRIEQTKNLEGVNEIQNILDVTFLTELAKRDLDVASLAEIEFCGEISGAVSKKSQLVDLEFFLQGLIKQKQGKKNPLLLALDNIAIKIFPAGRGVNKGLFKSEISNLEKKLSLYKGEDLQRKYLEIARLSIGLKDWAKAFDFINRALEVNDNNSLASEAKFYLGFVYKLKGEYAQARYMFNQLKESFSGELSDFVTYQQADCFYKIGRVNEALTGFERMFEKNPSSGINQLGQFRAGYVYLYDFGEEFKAYEAFMKLDKLSSQSKYGNHVKERVIPAIAEVYRGQGFKHLYSGYRFLEEGKYLEAFEQFNIALKINPLDALAYSGKGLALYFLNRFEESLIEGRKAKELASDNAYVLANLAFIYHELGLIDDAITELKAAIKIKPSVDVFRYDLGTMYALKEDHAKAGDQFRKVIKLNPDFAYANNNLGYILWTQKQYNEAKLFLEKAIDLKPDYVDAFYNLGVVLYTLGNYEEAKNKFLRVEDLNQGFRKTKRYLEELEKNLGY